jgi:O-antigen/teichoic acid export membrane protein
LGAGAAGVRAATRRQIRGSSLLVGGRLLSKGVNFAIQVLIVRYLSKADFGAFAYALSIVAVGETLVTCGLDRAVTRFVPIYHEKEDFRRMFGTVVMVLGTLAALGVSCVLGVYGLQAFLGDARVADPKAGSLLLILIFLAPVQAIDTVLIGLFAVFSNPRAIFFRRYVLAPGLKLAVVLMLVIEGLDVGFLAAGYLGAGVLGVLYCGFMLWRVIGEQELPVRFDLRSLEIPWRPVLAFTIPLLSSDLMYAVMHLMDTVMLERFRDTLAVGSFRAVQPAAHMNALVFASFGTLYTPLAARLFTRRDAEGIHHLYWQTAIWIAVLSFPVFAVTFSLAEPVTVLLFGAEYRESAAIMAILALGYYFNAALGMNGLTLKVYGRVGYVVLLNMLTVGVTVAANLLLIPRYGALGAAAGTTATLVFHNLLKQLGLRLHTDVRLFEPRYLRVYVVIAAAAMGLLLLRLYVTAPFALELAVAALASALVLRLSRHHLELDETMPELARLPLVARLLGR